MHGPSPTSNFKGGRPPVSPRSPPLVFTSLLLVLCLRGVQYVHWVVHKCIMVKVGEKRNTIKVCKKQVNLSKTEGNLSKYGGNNNFRETGGQCTDIGKIRGEIRNLWSMTKKKVMRNFGG